MNTDIIVEYSLWLRIVSTCFFIVGSGSNLLVFIVAHSTKKDAKSYLLLIQLVAIGNLIHALAGWSCTNRHTTENGAVIFISYGPLGLIHPHLSAIIDGISSQAVSFNPLMICLMMIFRVLILFGLRFKRQTVIIAVLGVYLLTLPIFYCMMLTYVPISEVTNISSMLQFEISRTAAYAFQGNSLLIDIQLYYTKISPLTIAVCVVCCAIVIWKLYKITENLSNKTVKIYRGFVYLMLVDSFIIFVYQMAPNMNWLSNFFQKTEDALLFLSFFSHPIFAIPRISQGLALLLLVPYLRSAFFGLFRKRQSSSIAVVTSNNSVNPVQSSTQ